MAEWRKIADKKAPHYLQIRDGKLRSSYRVRYRANGVALEKKLDGDFKTWRDAQTVADQLISNARFGEKKKPTSMVKSETLCDEIVKLKEPLDEDTYEQTEIFMRCHLKPFLAGECAYEKDDGGHPCQYRSYLDDGSCEFAANLNPTRWLAYKTHLRLHRPTASLFAHWKFWSMLCKYAFEKRILAEKFKLKYNKDKEDSRKLGKLLPPELVQAFIPNAVRVWKDRTRLGWMTGQRPGVIRKLRKDQVNMETGVCVVEKQDSKTRTLYDFVMPAPAMVILMARLEIPAVKDSPYFFPMETDHSRHMDKSLKGWHSAMRNTKASLLEAANQLASVGDHEGAGRRRQIAAGIDLGQDPYTPHDLRHTYLTHKFKKSSNPALVCYSCDISLEEAMETYVKFGAEDTRGIAEETAADIKALGGL